MLHTTKRATVLLLYGLSFLLTGYYFIASFPLSSYTLGQLAGVWAFNALGWQFLFSSRMKLLERGIGLDRLMVWHRWSGHLVLLLAAIHPLLLYWTRIPSLSFATILAEFTLYHWLGEAALIGLVIVVISSIFTVALQLSWQVWRYIHWLSYAVVLLASVHGYFLGSNINPGMPLYYWWWLVVAMIVISSVYRWGWLPIMGVRKDLEILTVRQLGKDVTQLVFERPEKFTYVPGQFAFVRLTASAVDREEHHFSLSSSPTEENLSMTIKNLGDYTAKIPAVRAGERLDLEGPYGVFSTINQQSAIVFIAGGIGITPIRAMLKHMVDTNYGKSVHLIYGVSTTEELAFVDEFSKWEKAHDWLQVDIFVSKYSGKTYHQGRIDDAFVTNEIKKYADARFYLCGPKSLTAMCIRCLKDAGVANSRIRTEEFNLK